MVFSMLEAEAEYVQQLHILVNNFLRPLRMAASSKKPPITHDDVSSIFLNRCAPEGRGRGARDRARRSPAGRARRSGASSTRGVEAAEPRGSEPPPPKGGCGASGPRSGGRLSMRRVFGEASDGQSQPGLGVPWAASGPRPGLLETPAGHQAGPPAEDRGSRGVCADTEKRGGRVSSFESGSKG